MRMTHNKPILILGSNSFSATSFVDYLLSAGYKVIGVSRSEEVERVFRPYGANSNLANFSFLQIDMKVGAKAIAELVNANQIEYIFNFAAQSMVAQSWDYPEHWYQTNVVALAELGNVLIKEKSIKKFVHFTTPEAYGSTSGWLKEDFNFAPSTPYAVSRAAGDWHLKCLFENYGFPVIFTRAANVYGPGQQLYRIIPRTILSALTGQKLPLHGGGKSIRSFIHIDDVSSALEAIMNHGENGDSYHISTDAITSIFDLVNTLANLLKIDVEKLVERGPERPGKDFAYQLSSQKIRTELGWTDKIGLNAGLADTLKWAELHLDELRRLPIDYEHKR
jgi:dTDP-glucose 4,6-dehydratase